MSRSSLRPARRCAPWSRLGAGFGGALLIVLCGLTTIQCVTVAAEPADLLSRPFGTLEDGRRSRTYSLRQGGITAKVSDFGATLLSLEAPDKDGLATEVLWGESDVSGLEEAAPSQSLRSLDQRLWEVLDQGQRDGLAFLRLGLEDAPNKPFPSGGRTEITCTLDAPGTLTMEVRASMPGVPLLPAGLAWNLGGAGAGTVLDHELQVQAERVLLLEDDGVYRPRPVGGTSLDFRTARALGLPRSNPLGAPWDGEETLYLLEGPSAPALDRQGRPPMRCALRLRHPASGRVLEVWTDYACIRLSCEEAAAPGTAPLPATLFLHPVPVPADTELRGAQPAAGEKESRRVAWRFDLVP